MMQFICEGPVFGRLFPSERAAQPSELPAPPARWRGWSRRRMSEPMWKERASEALIRAITISVCLSPAVRHPAFPLSTCAPIPIRFPEAHHFKFALTYTFSILSQIYSVGLKMEPRCTLKTTVSFVSKQLWISKTAASIYSVYLIAE